MTPKAAVAIARRNGPQADIRDHRIGASLLAASTPNRWFLI
jgi:hypothetical protein